MTAILDEEPTESELKELMKTLDTDHSGTVEWDEFVEAMTNWWVYFYFLFCIIFELLFCFSPFKWLPVIINMIQKQGSLGITPLLAR